MVVCTVVAAVVGFGRCIKGFIGLIKRLVRGSGIGYSAGLVGWGLFGQFALFIEEGLGLLCIVAAPFKSAATTVVYTLATSQKTTTKP